MKFGQILFNFQILNNKYGENVVFDNESDTNDEPIKLYEALNSISLLRKYISQSQNLGSGYEILDSFENIILNNRFINSKQTKITDFFKF